MICKPPFGGVLAFVFKGFAVGTFAFGRVCLMTYHFDVVKGAAVAVLAVICTVVYITANVFICAHNKNLLLFYCYFSL